MKEKILIVLGRFIVALVFMGFLIAVYALVSD